MDYLENNDSGRYQVYRDIPSAAVQGCKLCKAARETKPDRGAAVLLG